MINYIFNEDAYTLSIFSPTGEYVMVTEDNPNFYLIVNKIRKPDTKWADLENILTNKVFNYSIGFIKLFEENGNLYYQITGMDPVMVTGNLYKMIVSHSREACYKIYFERILDFIAMHENLIPVLENPKCYGISNNSQLLFYKWNGGDETFVETSDIPEDLETQEYLPIKNGNFGVLRNLNAHFTRVPVIEFLKEFWNIEDYEKLKKLTLNQKLQEKFKKEFQQRFTIFDLDMLDYSIEYMTNADKLYDFIMANIDIS